MNDHTNCHSDERMCLYVTHWVMDGGVLLEWTERDPPRYMMDDCRRANPSRQCNQQMTLLYIPQSPSYLSQLFSAPCSSYHTRSSSSRQLNLPATKSCYGQKAFSFTGASLWRSLPRSVRELQDYQAFSSRCADLFYST